MSEPASMLRPAAEPVRRPFRAAARALGLAVLLVAVGACAADAATRKVCGERQGTAGNAWLVDAQGKVRLELARQGGDQSLLDQADALVGRQGGEPGTQVGLRYCMTARTDARGKVVDILKAAPEPGHKPARLR